MKYLFMRISLYDLLKGPAYEMKADANRLSPTNNSNYPSKSLIF